MEPYVEKQLSKIVFNNEPFLSTHEADVTFNGRRIGLASHIRNFISNHELFKDKDVKVTFLGNGVSSLVSIVESPDKKLILKIPLRTKYSEGESQFLKVWERAGVKVPHVIEEGTIGEHSYILCEYIDAKTLAEVYSCEELIERKIYVEMGRILRMMHVPKAQGYGCVVKMKAEYSTFKEWLQSPELEKKINYVKENKLLGDEHGSLSDMLEILTTFVNKVTTSSYCHEDFTTYNIFDTDPLTVFDPNPRFNHGYIDLARCIFGTIWWGEPDGTRSQLLKGYFDDTTYDAEALRAAILLYSYMKLPYSHRTGKLKNITNVQEYLIKNK